VSDLSDLSVENVITDQRHQRRPNLAHRCHWEANSTKLIEKRIVKNRIEDMRKRRASDLEGRKAKLAALLESEDRMYEKEFHDNLETPEQVR